MTADFWTLLTPDKRVQRADLAAKLESAAATLAAQGCVQYRSARINGESVDYIWVEGWLVEPGEMPAFDAATLDPARQV